MEGRLARAEQSPWLRGEVEGGSGDPFSMSINWMCKLGNFEKIDNGNYDDKSGSKPGITNSVLPFDPGANSLDNTGRIVEPNGNVAGAGCSPADDVRHRAATGKATLWYDLTNMPPSLREAFERDLATAYAEAGVRSPKHRAKPRIAREPP